MIPTAKLLDFQPSNARSEGWMAVTPFGPRYIVAAIIGGGFAVYGLRDLDWGASIAERSCATRQAAFDRCQADFEARVRDCLKLAAVPA